MNVLIEKKTWFTELWEKRNDENFRELVKEDFRIYPNSFVDIVDLVEGNISKQDTKFRKAIPAENVLQWLCGDWQLESLMEVLVRHLVSPNLPLSI